MLLSNLVNKNYNIKIEQKSDDYFDSKEQIARHCSELKGQYIIMGAIGRKGPKNDKFRIGHTVMKLSRYS